MLGVSEGNIIDHIKGQEQPPDSEPDPIATITYNQTDPTVHSDGIDRVTVGKLADDRYLIDYWGYRMGHLEVTRAGLEELGEYLFADRARVPRWILESYATDDLPWWIPDGVEGAPSFNCDRCGATLAAEEVLTPGSMDGDPDHMFCWECWEEIRGEWHPDFTLADHSPLDRAKELRFEATHSPAGVALDELRELLHADEPEIQVQALQALKAVTAERGSEVVEFVPRLDQTVDSSHQGVRTAGLQWFATLAEDYPAQAAPVAPSVIDRLAGSASDDEVGAAINYVAAVAASEPGAVVDAVPRLTALLQETPPAESSAVLALTRIAEEYPEAVLPAADLLLEYIEDTDGSATTSALAAIGYLSKPYPNVAERAIPRLIDLLDADSRYYRANAGGVLADLADEYPGEVREAVPQATDLLNDIDEKARYNATSILARVAKAYPGDVEPAIGALIDVLEDDFPYTRSNACWALGYVEATTAEAYLETLAESDPNEDVEEAAKFALGQLR